MKGTFLIWSAVLVGAVTASQAQAQSGCGSCGTPIRTMYRTVYDQQPVTSYRLEYETVFEERQVVSQRPEWTVEQRERRYTVAKPITETSFREERWVRMKPVQETEIREDVYDKVSYVTETATRQERYMVQRPVQETQYRDQQYTVRRAYQETVMQQQQYQTYQPVTSYYNQTVDQGGYVNSTAYQPGPVRNQLAWVPRGYATDAATGVPFRHRAGFHWVPTQQGGTYQVQTNYVPNYVTQQVPVTSLMPQTCTQEVPVQVTRYADEVVTQKVPIQVTRYEQAEEIREVPYTYQKPVTERVVQKVEIPKLRYEQEEMVRQVPVTTTRIEYEERVEPVQVRVMKMVSETSTVQVPKTVEKWVPYQATRLVPRTVAMRVASDAYGSYILDSEVSAPAMLSPEVTNPGTTVLSPSYSTSPSTSSPADSRPYLPSSASPVPPTSSQKVEAKKPETEGWKLQSQKTIPLPGSDAPKVLKPVTPMDPMPMPKPEQKPDKLKLDAEGPSLDQPNGASDIET